MPIELPLHVAVARALRRVVPPDPTDPTVRWCDVADAFVCALAGNVTLLPTSEYEKLDRIRRSTEKEPPPCTR